MVQHALIENTPLKKQSKYVMLDTKHIVMIKDTFAFNEFMYVHVFTQHVKHNIVYINPFQGISFVAQGRGICRCKTVSLLFSKVCPL